MAYWLGGSRSEVPDAYEDASPISHLDAEDSPIFFFHGERDGLVRISGAKKMSEKMESLGINTEFLLIPKAGHFAAVFNFRAFEEGFDFLEKHLQAKRRVTKKHKEK